jgi:alpha-tubulin suppressor-like RCC1 family protein/tRNA A-37 threonylcarbamoyl transferase component Bud32
MSVSKKNFKVLIDLKEEILNEIKLLYVFKQSHSDNVYENAFLVTNEDKVYAFGYNKFGFLGFGDSKKIKKLLINKDLSNKQIVDFKNGKYHAIARTIDGEVYCWGFNIDSGLGNGRTDNKIYKPEANEILSDKKIVEISCGRKHTLALTNEGEVYAWGKNRYGQVGNNEDHQIQALPIKITGFEGEKVVMISCGSKHSMALTESGRVYSWGRNIRGQLGLHNSDDTNKPSAVILFDEIPVKTISCGRYHSLLLSRDGDIYWFGYNGIERKIIPENISTNTNKFIDIASHHNYNISIALSVDGIYYVWGPCGGGVIIKPRPIEFDSFEEIFANYFNISYKEINRLEGCLKSLNPNNKLNLKTNKFKTEFYEQNFIASGNFGIVYEVIDKEWNKKFAIKRISFNEHQKGKVLKETEVMAELSSKYIVKCFDIWIEENYFLSEINEKTSESNANHEVFNAQKPFLLHIQMELCYKTMKEIIQILKTELKQRKYETMTPLGYYISTELFIELLECVHYLHEQKLPIIHRDLKPSNILITYGKNGRFVKLADFGLATFHEFKEQSHTKYTGTQIYVAPEVMQSKHYDMKADIYSLGVIALKLFNIDINK